MKQLSLFATGCLLAAISSAAWAGGERPSGAPVLLQPSDVALTVDSASLNRQYQALASMPSVKVSYSALGPVRLVEGDTGMVLSSRARALREGDPGPEILDAFNDLLLANGNETLTVRLNQPIGGRYRVINLDQSIRGIRVIAGDVSVKVEDASGLVRSMGAHFLPDRGLPLQSKLTARKAATLAVQMLESRGRAKAKTAEVSSTPELAYYGTQPGTTRPRLVWAVIAHYETPEGDKTDGEFWLDAIDGEFVGETWFSQSAMSSEQIQNIWLGR